MDNVHRPARRIISHSNGSVDTQVPQIYGTMRSLPVSLSSAQACYSSQGVHSSGQRIEEDSLESVSNRFLVHQRLVKLGGFLQSVCTINSKAHKTDSIIGLDDQCGVG